MKQPDYAKMGYELTKKWYDEKEELARSKKVNAKLAWVAMKAFFKNLLIVIGGFTVLNTIRIYFYYEVLGEKYTGGLLAYTSAYIILTIYVCYYILMKLINSIKDF